MRIFGKLPVNERGATSIEYTLLASLIGLVLLAALASIGMSLGDIMNTAGNAMGN